MSLRWRVRGKERREEGGRDKGGREKLENVFEMEGEREGEERGGREREA